jgi:TatD DNase family protein
MRLVDTHCHLESEEFSETLDTLIADAARLGVVKLITASIVPEQWPQSLTLARKYVSVECALGVHPWYIQPEFESRLDELYRARDDGAVAIGEIGLDRKAEKCDYEIQRHFCERQLAIACDINLPVIIHCRAAFDDLLHVLKQTGAPQSGGIVHSYGGSPEIVHSLRRYGLAISMGGSLTFRNSRKKLESLRAAWPEWLVLETDSPDISPVEAPERPNVPANIVYNLRAAAELLGVPEDEVAETTTQNAARIFNLEI